jgi:hypothetical protein
MLTFIPGRSWTIRVFLAPRNSLKKHVAFFGASQPNGTGGGAVSAAAGITVPLASNAIAAIAVS